MKSSLPVLMLLLSSCIDYSMVKEPLVIELRPGEAKLNGVSIAKKPGWLDEWRGMRSYFDVLKGYEGKQISIRCGKGVPFSQLLEPWSRARLRGLSSVLLYLGDDQNPIGRFYLQGSREGAIEYIHGRLDPDTVIPKDARVILRVPADVEVDTMHSELKRLSERPLLIEELPTFR